MPWGAETHKGRKHKPMRPAGTYGDTDKKIAKDSGRERGTRDERKQDKGEVWEGRRKIKPWD